MLNQISFAFLVFFAYPNEGKEGPNFTRYTRFKFPRFSKSVFESWHNVSRTGDRMELQIEKAFIDREQKWVKMLVSKVAFLRFFDFLENDSTLFFVFSTYHIFNVYNIA